MKNVSQSIIFVQGRLYRRQELHDKFGGQRQGGISTPLNHPMILLFDTPSGEEYGYQDGWTYEGTYRWTGEGQVGDQALTRGNLAIANHLEEGEDIHLFKQEELGYFRYIGQMISAGYKWELGSDKQGNQRRIVVFDLLPIEAAHAISRDYNIKPGKDLRTLRKQALSKASFEPSSREDRVRNAIQRSRTIREYVLLRAGENCEACRKPAPFLTRNDRPYLETHHLRRLSDGGPDHPNYVAGLCPNCHRKAHYSKNKMEFNKEIEALIKQKEKKIE